MRATMEVRNPEVIELTMKLTMTYKEWLVLQKQLQRDNWPSHDLFSLISQMLGQANQTYGANTEKALD